LGIVAWLILGLVSGFVASGFVDRTGEGLVMDITLAVTGAFAGGFVFTHFAGEAAVTGLNLYSMFLAVVGAVLALMLYHLIFRRQVR